MGESWVRLNSVVLLSVGQGKKGLQNPVALACERGSQPLPRYLAWPGLEEMLDEYSFPSLGQTQ